MRGKVSRFDDRKGYGFIEVGGKEYFVHYTEIQGDGFKTLRPGDEVEFDAYVDDISGQDRRIARKVVRV